MNTQIDWREELDGSFGEGPDVDLGRYLEAGHRATRRRRAGVSAAGLAAAAVVGGVVWAMSPGDVVRSSSDLPVATQPAAPTPTATPSESSPPVTTTSAPATPSPTQAALATGPGDVRVATPAEREQVSGPIPVAALGDGGLVVRPGWVVDRVEVVRASARDGIDQRRQWGLVVSPEASPDEDTWVFVDWDVSGTSTTSADPAGKWTDDLDTWIEQQQAMQRMDQMQAARPVAHTEDGKLVADTDLQVLETVEHPQQAAAYGPVDESVAAKVRLADGTVLFVLARADDSLTVEPAVLDAPTMAAFLQHLAAQGASGEGVR